MPSARGNKRRIERIRLDCPISAKLNSVAVSLVDLSVGGARIEHSAALPTGKQVHLEFTYLDRTISVPCFVLRCKLLKAENGVIYCSGLRYGDPKDPAVVELHQMITDMVQRDLKARRQHLKRA